MMRSDWFRGPLLSRHFAEQVLPHAFASRLGETSADAAHRRLRRWLTTAYAVLGPASGLRAICEVGAAPLFATLGYRVRGATATSDPSVLRATLEGAQGVALPLVIALWNVRLDQTWRLALRVERPERSPTPGPRSRERWAFGFNGRCLRLMDLDRPYARRFLELDLAETIQDAARCRLLWAIARPAAFTRPASHPPLLTAIVDACDAHGLSVREALQGGVREALELLCGQLARAARQSRSGGAPVPPAEVVSQGLTLLYRVLFLLFAEARALVPVWHPLYRDSYTIGTLHRQAERPSPRGLWDALQAISRLAHAGCETDELSMTAFNSQLFSPECAPLVDRARIDSGTIGRVLRALMTAPDRPGRARERISYADLGVEQLGAVYERILDYAPQLEETTATHLERRTRSEEDARSEGSARTPEAIEHAPGRRRHADGSVPGTSSRGLRARPSVRRKESGTFYTPRGLADYLVRETLGPLTSFASADRILTLRVLDPGMGSGAFLVSACRFLAHAYEQALAREGRPLPATDGARAEIRRTIARQCLFGIDVNPMAVQLARLSLWLTTLTTDAPLTFLDHHLRVGDSLIGASLDDLTRRLPARPLAKARSTRRDSATLPLFSADETSRLMRAIVPSRARFTISDDRPETVHEKERLLATLARDSALGAWLTLADVWCASWFWPRDEAIGTPAAPASAAPGKTVGGTDAGVSAVATALPQTAWAPLCDHVLHGGSVLPAHVAAAWLARARAVAARHRFFHWTLEFPEVFFDASGEPRRDGGFDAIVGNPPWDMVRDDVQARGASAETREASAGSSAAMTRFVREAGIYDALGEAHVNSYQLFVDRSLSLLRDGGRLGVVVPWGLAADHGSARLRRRLLERCDVDTMISFDNRDGLFPIHRSLRFLLFTCTTGRPTTRVTCRFGERDPAVLDRMEETGHADSLSIAPALLRRVSGEGLAFPDVRSRDGLALLERLHATWPALTSADGWGVTFGRELNITDDRTLFTTRSSAVAEDADGNGFAAASGWPVLEGKHLQPFLVRADQARFAVPPARMDTVRGRVPGVMRHRLAYRDVSSATNRVTLIAAIVPPLVVSTHTLFCLRSRVDLDAQHCLCALMNSYVANYLVRLRVGTHVTVALLDHLPMPAPDALRAWNIFHRLAALAAQLSRPQGVGAGALALTHARLQGLAAHAYGLTPDELRHVLSTFPLVNEAEKRAAFDAFHREV